MEPSLAVLSVYAGRQLRADLVRLQLLQLTSNTKQVRWCVYSAVTGVTRDVLELLLQCDEVKICDIPPTVARGNVQHGYYLNALAEIAVSDNVSHLCALDPDAFPIVPEWFDVSCSRTLSESAFVAILRKENGDQWLSHPSFLFCQQSFFTSYRPSFMPNREAIPDSISDHCWELLISQQEPDTGYAFAVTAAMNGLPWTALLRSNSHNQHYLISGIYGGMIFHLGGGSRRDLVYRGDHCDIRERNRQIFDHATADLLRNPNAYIGRLRGSCGQTNRKLYEIILPTHHLWHA